MCVARGLGGSFKYRLSQVVTTRDGQHYISPVVTPTQAWLAGWLGCLPVCVSPREAITYRAASRHYTIAPRWMDELMGMQGTLMGGSFPVKC